MKTIASIMRIALLLALGIPAILLLTGEETDETQALWLLHLAADKAAGLILGYAFVRLYGRWAKTDPWLSRIDAWNRKETDITDTAG